MYELTQDTIVAVASPPGGSPRGMVRISGAKAIEIAGRLFEPAAGVDLASQPGFTRTVGYVILGERRRAPAECYLFKAPHSYTRQDCVELHTVGSPPLLAGVLDRAIALGARPALPGEFTARAFMSGRIDLTRAESVAAIIRARSDAELRATQGNLRGELCREILAIGDDLTELVGLVEADIDFSEEPIDFIRPAELVLRVERMLTRLERLTASAGSTERLSHLPRIALVGLPNAGKSSLLNALCEVDRSICSPLAGATRDVITGHVQLPGCEAILLDVAGHAEAADELGRAAQQATRQAIDQADLLCLVVDATDPDLAAPRRALPSPCTWPVVVALNKVDLCSYEQEGRRFATGGEIFSALFTDQAPVPNRCHTEKDLPSKVSAATGAGLPALRQALADGLGSVEALAGWSISLNARQRDCSTSAASALRRAASLAGQAKVTIDCAELVAFELREALNDLGAVTGEISTDDILDRVFSTFCIGK